MDFTRELKIFNLDACFWLILITSVCRGDGADITHPSAYKLESLCHSDRDPSSVKGCMRQVEPDNGMAIIFRPSLDCARYCSLDKLCIGYSYNYHSRQIGCYLHYNCALSQRCDSQNCGHLVFYRRQATRSECEQASGRWSATANSCHCSNGCVGRRCERLPESCSELALWGQTKPYPLRRMIKPPGFQQGFSVLCRTYLAVKTALTVFLKNLSRNNYSPLKCDWNKCVTGFFTQEGNTNIWSGLEKIRYLSTVTNSKTLTLKFTLTNTGSIKMVYRDIQIGDSSAHYALSYSTYHVENELSQTFASVHNCLPLSKGSSLGIPFSTPDADHDLDTGRNCAQIAGRGWWFSQCDPRPVCNPMGDVVTQSADNEALWFSGKNVAGIAPIKSRFGVTAYFTDNYTSSFAGL
ncbi:hypothetical protein RRG08_027359 [Elysia crispata]|uniref:Fibrinogen C-terminal domain-containing protein n=1 Tax=Elysia crispata TaxID=231223 RepID=A0AAE0YLR5_9GAST|nr:hypothetical protein RRG08_027359 [Elysia crispata]